MRIVRFRDHIAIPRYFKVGVEGDHHAEQIKFELPQFDENQTAVLYWQQDERADMIVLDHGVWDVENTRTQYAGESECYVTVTVGGTLKWSSEPFTIRIVGLEDVEETIQQEWPTVLTQAAQATTAANAAAQSANAAADAANAAAAGVGQAIDSAVEYITTDIDAKVAAAAASAAAAAGSETAAAGSASAAAGYRDEAYTYADEAGSNAMTAENAKDAAALSAGNAAASANAAATSEANAAASQAAAAASQAAAAVSAGNAADAADDATVNAETAGTFAGKALTAAEALMSGNGPDWSGKQTDGTLTFEKNGTIITASGTHAGSGGYNYGFSTGALVVDSACTAAMTNSDLMMKAGRAYMVRVRGLGGQLQYTNTGTRKYYFGIATCPVNGTAVTETVVKTVTADAEVNNGVVRGEEILEETALITPAEDLKYGLYFRDTGRVTYTDLTWCYEVRDVTAHNIPYNEGNRVTSLDSTAITDSTVVETIGTPTYVNDVTQYSAYGLTDKGWYVFARIAARNGEKVTSGRSVTGAAGYVAALNADHIDVAVKFGVTAQSQAVTVNWGKRTEKFIFKATDLAVRNLDYLTTFYIYDLDEFVTWTYALTEDATFVTDKAYYTKDGDVYTLAEVTAGEAVPADTYYNHSKATFAGMTKNVTYKLDTMIDCPIEIVLPEVDDEGRGAWFEIQMRYNSSYSCTLLPPEGVKVGTVSTQAQTAGVNVLDLQYTGVGGVKMWSLLNTHSNIPA